MLAALALLAAAAQAAPAIPPAWLGAAERADLLWTADDGQVDPNLLPSIGNGNIAVASVDAGLLFSSGVYTGNQTDPPHAAGLPWLLGAALGGGDEQPAALDLRGAAYSRLTELAPGVTATQTWYAHRVNRTVAVMELDVAVDAAVWDGEPVEAAVTPLFALPAAGDVAGDWLAAPPAGAVGWAGETVRPETPDSPTHALAIVASALPAALNVTGPSSRLFVAATGASAAADWAWAQAQSAAALRASHAAAWAQLWTSGVDVGGGRPDLALAFNSSAYFVLSSLRADLPTSTSPGGLGTDGYNSHRFWDADTWVLPALQLLQPDIARSMLQYRCDTRAGAAAKAASYAGAGYEGYMFAWESAETGVETCPLSAPTGLLEQHISADVALAVRDYVRLHGADAWVEECGRDVVYGVADFWASRLSPVGGVDCVIPPDEYAYCVNNSAYTNAAAALALDFAGELSGSDRWAAAAEQLRRTVPYDAARDFHPEYDGYARGTLIKQADVVLLGYPLQWPMNASTRARDLAVYENVTDAGGPAMTWAMHAVAALELGGRPEALTNRSFANAQPPFYVWTETPTGGANNFITGCGGFLQLMLNGWGGVRVRGDGVAVAPTLPAGVSSLALRGLRVGPSTVSVVLGGSLSLSVSVTSGAVEVRGVGVVSAGTTVEVEGGEVVLSHPSSELSAGSTVV